MPPPSSIPKPRSRSRSTPRPRPRAPPPTPLPQSPLRSRPRPHSNGNSDRRREMAGSVNASPTSGKFSFRALFPGIDLLNFDAESKNYFVLVEDTIAYVAGIDYRKGDEIRDSYGGSKNDTYLLVHYGFLHKDATKSYVVLDPPLREDDDQNQVALKHKLIQAAATFEQPAGGRPEVRVRAHDIDGVQALRLGLMPAQEMSAHTVHAMLSRSPLSVDQLRGTESAAMAWLSATCWERHLAIRKHDSQAKSFLHEGQLSALLMAYRERTARLWYLCFEVAEARLRFVMALFEQAGPPIQPHSPMQVATESPSSTFPPRQRRESPLSTTQVTTRLQSKPRPLSIPSPPPHSSGARATMPAPQPRLSRPLPLSKSLTPPQASPQSQLRIVETQRTLVDATVKAVASSSSAILWAHLSAQPLVDLAFCSLRAAMELRPGASRHSGRKEVGCSASIAAAACQRLTLPSTASSAKAGESWAGRNVSTWHDHWSTVSTLADAAIDASVVSVSTREAEIHQPLVLQGRYHWLKRLVRAALLQASRSRATDSSTQLLEAIRRILESFRCRELSAPCISDSNFDFATDISAFAWLGKLRGPAAVDAVFLLSAELESLHHIGDCGHCVARSQSRNLQPSRRGRSREAAVSAVAAASVAVADSVVGEGLSGGKAPWAPHRRRN